MPSGRTCRRPERFFLLLVTAGALAAACATSYHPQARRGDDGYREVPIERDVFYVEFKGNAYTGYATATEYWWRRAGELCAAKGLVAREVRPDPFSAPAPPLIRTYFMGGFLFTMGEPLGAATDAHSKAGFVSCDPSGERKP